MSANRIRIAIVGCGNIAAPYAEQIKTYATCELVGFSDVDASRSPAFARRFDGKSYEDLAALLAPV